MGTSFIGLTVILKFCSTKYSPSVILILISATPNQSLEGIKESVDSLRVKYPVPLNNWA